MKQPRYLRSTMLAAALAVSFAAGPAWSQGAPSSPTPGSATGSAPAAKGGATAGKTELSRADRSFVMDAARAGTQCVEPADVMRRRHMDFLKHQRDETVLGGVTVQVATPSLPADTDKLEGIADCQVLLIEGAKING